MRQSVSDQLRVEQSQATHNIVLSSPSFVPCAYIMTGNRAVAFKIEVKKTNIQRQSGKTKVLYKVTSESSL